MIDNYLAAEALIITRLKAKLTGAIAVRNVLGAWDQAQIEESAQPTPAVHIAWEGDQVLPTVPPGKQIRIAQVWTIYVAIRNWYDGEGQAAREEAGPIMTGVHKALQGWKPGPQHGAMNRANGPPHFISDAGISYYPMSFTTLIVAESGN